MADFFEVSITEKKGKYNIAGGGALICAAGIGKQGEK